MQTPSWNDLALFAAVARHGALAPAAQETGTSSATLSRRMTALEAQMSRRLFQHGGRGYAPTADGRALLARAERMEAAAAEVAQWQAAQSGPARVRISAGTWTALDLAQNAQKFWSPNAPWVPEFIHCNQDMDIARREIDIGLRARRPAQPWLAGRAVGQVHFAVYGRPGVTAWIGTSHDAAATRSAQWVREHHEDKITTSVNDPKLALSLAEAGVGNVVLPMFVGEVLPTLIRQSDPISDLTHDRWIVSHHEGRFDPSIRAALDALTAYFASKP